MLISDAQADTHTDSILTVKLYIKLYINVVQILLNSMNTNLNKFNYPNQIFSLSLSMPLGCQVWMRSGVSERQEEIKEPHKNKNLCPESNNKVFNLFGDEKTE